MRLFKSQVKTLREKIHKFNKDNEAPLHENVYVAQVHELLIRPFAVGFDQLEERHDIVKPEEVRGGVYPFFTGVVFAASPKAREKGVVEGDLVRFTPLQGEVFKTLDQKTDIVSTDVIFCRGKSFNIWEYDGEADPVNEKKEEDPFEIAPGATPVPLEDNEDIPAVVYRSQGNDVN